MILIISLLVGLVLEISLAARVDSKWDLEASGHGMR